MGGIQLDRVVEQCSRPWQSPPNGVFKREEELEEKKEETRKIHQNP